MQWALPGIVAAVIVATLYGDLQKWGFTQKIQTAPRPSFLTVLQDTQSHTAEGEVVQVGSLVELTGIEPVTSTVTGLRDKPLHYRSLNLPLTHPSGIKSVFLILRSYVLLLIHIEPKFTCFALSDNSCCNSLFFSAICLFFIPISILN